MRLGWLVVACALGGLGCGGGGGGSSEGGGGGGQQASGGGEVAGETEGFDIEGFENEGHYPCHCYARSGSKSCGRFG